jgi:hypothetical protein
MMSDPQSGEHGQRGRHFSRQREGLLVETRTHHPSPSDQTRLSEQQGWRCILAERLSAKRGRLRSERSGRRILQLVGPVPFTLTGLAEHLRWFEAGWLDTPVRCRRFALKRRFR